MLSCSGVGGQKVLEKVLRPSANQHVELAQLRTHIRRCFSSIRCFLMPHPGLEVATSQQFDGRLDVINKSFRGALMELMPILFRPEHIVPKQIDSVDVEIGELVGALLLHSNTKQIMNEFLTYTIEYTCAHFLRAHIFVHHASVFID